MPVTLTNNVITYSAPENKALFDQTGCIQDNDFAVVAKDNDVKQVVFSIGGTADTKTTIATAPTANRTVTLPDMAGTFGIVETPQYSAPIAAATVTMTASTLILEPAGTLATLTVTLPAGSYNGQIVRVCSTEEITALTLNASGSDTIVTAITSIAADTGFSLVYRSTTAKWYKLA